MNKQAIIKKAAEYIQSADANRIQKEYAISEELVGVPMYAEPLFAFGSADDPLFEQLKNADIVGSHHVSPKEWLTGAKTVISIFLPASMEVKNSNRTNACLPSAPWLHARIEGQKFINQFSLYIKDLLAQSGAQAVVPFLDARYWAKVGNISNYQNAPDSKEGYTSNWSERHAAYICGMGTFGLSRGLITQKGVAGRFCSIVTDAYLEPDIRPYSALYEYCSHCGACERRCPALAISLEKGKEHSPCSAYLDKMQEQFRPRSACGKCQAGVPCESRIPEQ